LHVAVLDRSQGSAIFTREKCGRVFYAANKKTPPAKGRDGVFKVVCSQLDGEPKIF